MATINGTTAGNDLKGTGVAGRISGRGGTKRFLYACTKERKPAASGHIGDFGRAQGDRIDLPFTDADEQAAGGWAFRFAGRAEPSAADAAMQAGFSLL